MIGNISTSGGLPAQPSQHALPRKEKDSSSRQFFDFEQQSKPSNAMVLHGNRLSVIKKEDDDSAYSSVVDEDELVRVKAEPELELESPGPKKLLGVQQTRERMKLINPNYDPENEIGVENCLPCVISFYNWVLSGSEEPEAVDPKAKSRPGHMHANNNEDNLLWDPLLDDLNNPKEVLDVDSSPDGKVRTYTCVANELPETFKPVLFKELKKVVAKEAHTNGVAWHQYEKGGEKFKFGILYLNHSDDPSKAHFLAFQYRLVNKKSANGKKTKKEYELYIADPQPNQPDADPAILPIFMKFSDYYKSYKGSYTDKIYMWTGWNSINYDCNKRPKEIFASLKTEEMEEDFQPSALDRIDQVAEGAKVKTGQKRTNDGNLESEITKRTKTGDQSRAASMPFSLETSGLSPLSEEVQEMDVEKTLSSVATSKSPERGTSPSRDEELWVEESVTECESEDEEVRHIREDIRKKDACVPSDIRITVIPDDSDEIAKEKEVVSEWKERLQEKPVPNTQMQSAYVQGKPQPIFQNQRIQLVNMPVNPQLVLQNQQPAATHASSSTGGVANILKEQQKQIQLNQTYQMGLHYAQGIMGYPKDAKKAFECFKSAADSGYSLAQFTVGCAYAQSEGVPFDLKEAFNYLRKAANQGHQQAQNFMWQIYFADTENQLDLGADFSPVDIFMRTKYLVESGKGTPSDMFELGKMYQEGLGTQLNPVEASKHLTLAANNGCVEAQAYVGRMHLYLEAHSVLYTLTLNYSIPAAEKGHPLAQGTLAAFYMASPGVKKDLKLALKYLTPAVAAGDPLALHTMAEMCLKGKDVAYNLEAYYEYTKRAAQGGIAPAQYNLGLMYLRGKGVQKNIDEAIENFKLAAREVKEAAHQLGLIFYKGLEGVPKDMAQAMFYFKMAADKQHWESRAYVGRMYYLGQGVNANKKLAEQYSCGTSPMGRGTLGALFSESRDGTRREAEGLGYLMKAVNEGDALAQYTLSKLYLTGEVVLKKSPKKAFKLCQFSADQGYAPAQAALGRMYYEGEYVPHDMAEAFRYFSLAAQQGDTEGLAGLAIVNLKSQNEADQANGLENLKRAALAGEPISLLWLGTFYLSGQQGLQQNFYEAYKYLKRAADLLNPVAEWYVANMLLVGNGVTQDKNQAFIYMQRSADHEYPDAQYDLAGMYLNGRGTNINVPKAIEYYTKAADKGHISSQFRMGDLCSKESNPRDLKKAIYYYSLVAENGGEKSEEARARIAELSAK